MARPYHLLVFCDIDGVFNCYNPDLVPIDSSILKLFISVLDKHQAKIVFTSSQRRIYDLDMILQRNALEELQPYVHEQWATPSVKNAKRGDEVNDWFRRYGNATHYYCCLDDNSDYVNSQPLIKTNTYTGLTPTDIDLIDIYLTALPQGNRMKAAKTCERFDDYRLLYSNLKTLDLALAKSYVGYKTKLPTKRPEKEIYHWTTFGREK